VAGLAAANIVLVETLHEHRTLRTPSPARSTRSRPSTAAA